SPPDKLLIYLNAPNPLNHQHALGLLKQRYCHALSRLTPLVKDDSKMLSASGNPTGISSKTLTHQHSTPQRKQWYSANAIRTRWRCLCASCIPLPQSLESALKALHTQYLEAS